MVPPSPSRFHARFFRADAAALRGALGGNDELLDLQWIPLPEVSSLPVAEVPRFMLAHAVKLITTPTRVTGSPVFRFGPDGPTVRYL